MEMQISMRSHVTKVDGTTAIRISLLKIETHLDMLVPLCLSPHAQVPKKFHCAKPIAQEAHVLYLENKS